MHHLVVVVGGAGSGSSVPYFMNNQLVDPLVLLWLVSGTIFTGSSALNPHSWIHLLV